MKHPFKMKMVAGLFIPALAVSMSAYAADTSTSAGKTSPPAGATTNGQTDGSTTRASKQAFRDMRATKLIGMDVTNRDGKSLGEVQDLVVDVNNGRVRYAVLSFGEFLGLGGKLFAYPIGVFSPAADGDKLVLNVDRSKLEAAPGFERGRYPEWNHAKYDEDVDKYFGPTVTLKPMPDQQLRRATELIGKDVKGRNGNDIGDIDDLVVNMGNGDLHYAVLEFDSGKMDGKLLALPIQAFTYTPQRDELVLNVDESKLDTKLAFDKDAWPDLNNPTYLVDVDRYLVLVVPTSAQTTAQSTRSDGGSAAASGSSAAGDKTSAASSSGPATRTASNGTSGTTTASGASASASDTFARLDTDNNGELSAAEVKKDSQVKDMWHQMNKGGDATISRSEFMSTYPGMAK